MQTLFQRPRLKPCRCAQFANLDEGEVVNKYLSCEPLSHACPPTQILNSLEICRSFYLPTCLLSHETHASPDSQRPTPKACISSVTAARGKTRTQDFCSQGNPASKVPSSETGDAASHTEPRITKHGKTWKVPSDTLALCSTPTLLQPVKRVLARLQKTLEMLVTRKVPQQSSIRSSVLLTGLVDVRLRVSIYTSTSTPTLICCHTYTADIC